MKNLLIVLCVVTALGSVSTGNQVVPPRTKYTDQIVQASEKSTILDLTLDKKKDSIVRKADIISAAYLKSEKDRVTAINRADMLEKENLWLKSMLAQADSAALVNKSLPSKTESDYAVKDTVVHKTKIGKIISKIF